jgi:hypothetical protein
MTQPLDYGRKFLAAVQALTAALEDIQLYTQMGDVNSTLLADATVPGSYLNAPGARTDLTGADMAYIQQASKAVVDWSITPQSATNNVTPNTYFYLAQ